MEYRVFKSLIEDINSPSVWLGSPALPPRTIVHIKNTQNGKSVYCEALHLEDNFLEKYNEPPRISIKDPQSAIVINAWYRKGLGIPDDKKTLVSLDIKPSDSWWGQIRASLNQPDNTNRLSMAIALISFLLGLIGFALGIITLFKQ